MRLKGMNKSQWQAAMLAFVTGSLLVAAGCRQDMQVQPRYKPLAPSDFWGDGRSARPPVPGTVA